LEKCAACIAASSELSADAAPLICFPEVCRSRHNFKPCRVDRCFLQTAREKLCDFDGHWRSRKMGKRFDL
jgi:hypothetical protein